MESNRPPTADAASALVVAGLHKRFGGTVAVEHMDLVVPQGSLTALLGPSGCGKTTALRSVAGLLSPDRGTISIDGRIVSGPGVHVPPEQRRIGMVFQDYALFPHLSVAKNVAYGLTGVARAQRRRRVAEVLDLVGLGAFGSRLPVALSGGQQQRVALARALAPEPELILLDEPFSNLDAALRTVVREDVRTILQAAGATALFVTHDQEEALSLADRVVVMDQGRVHQVADPQTLYTQPATRFVAEFVGEADILTGRRVDRFVVDTSLGRLATSSPVEGHQCSVVVRPESLRLVHDAQGRAVVTAISYFGHDQLVQVQLADGLVLRARRGPALDLRRGDRVQVHVDGPVVVFDDTTTASSDVLAPA
ncbi:ABC transporter ATP-binding protein [Egicoccus sp. AB-alg6-2]|uniref:ABC transporter ATP-binding protein n=1 Tax=Egicoccus sp. AB-alg6-2 TaxID=3242692 RepID=UPI00359EEBF0